MKSLNGISIVICTYNGASRLKPTLDAIFALKIPDTIPWELIIVDNASTDNTAEFCKSEIAANHFEKQARVVSEPQAGCNHARLKGLKEIKYNWLLFCDDDNYLFDDYIQKAWGVLNANPSIGVLGGQGIAKFENEEPAWFARYSKSFAVGPQNSADGKFSDQRRKLYSAGSFFRANALLQYYEKGFVALLDGPKGEELTRGEDTEWCIMIELLGYDLWYCSELKFYHFMPQTRMTWAYYLKLKKGIASGSSKFEAYAPFNTLGKSTMLSFYVNYFKNYFFYHVVWIQFGIRKSIQPKRYSGELLALGLAIHPTTARAYRIYLKKTRAHFKQLKSFLKK